MSSELKVQKFDVNVPTLEEVSQVLEKGLTKYFETVNVSVVDCPDLRQEPFNLAQTGLSGNPRTADIGGVPYLVPLVQRDKYYSFQNIADLMGMKEKAFIIGAGAGPWKEVGANCELMPNISFEDNQQIINNRTHLAQIDENGKCQVRLAKTTDFALLMNVFVCEGKPGKVLKVNVKKRIGSDNFVTAMRLVLDSHYQNRVISVGGVFLLSSGTAKLHIMPDFSKVALNSNDDVNNWLQYYTMSSPLICLSVFHSSDPGLDLRVEHTHCFSEHNQGGHYHYDLSPDTVEYEGYFNLGEQIYRIDAPVTTHQIGRD